LLRHDAMTYIYCEPAHRVKTKDMPTDKVY